VRLLFDQNLSHRLIGCLSDLFPDSLHVRILGLAEADDLAIWNYAKEHGLVIVTQDADFSEWNKLRGAPPKIIWIRCGNASVDMLHSKLRNAANRIFLLDNQPDLEVIEIW
jgi:predicted nuclease of predicted toxin-antitoxin system